MRSFFFAAKIALLFVLLLGLSLGGALILFIRIAAPELAEDISRLRAYQAVSVAEKLEAVLAEEPPPPDGRTALGSPRLEQTLRRLEERTDLRLRVGAETAPPAAHRPRRNPFHPPVLEVDGRRLHQLGPPAFDIWLPLNRDGERIGHLRVRGPSHAAQVHLAFERGLLRIAGLSLISVLVLSLVLTRPLRRMSRSMDRIAAGELDHRVAVRGRDEVAAMGTSFNAMADRIQEMIVGQKEMLAGVSHELRSPLGRMKMTLELLREREDVRAERLQALEQEVDHVDALVDEILTASRLDLGTTPLQLEPLDLRRAAEDAWQSSERHSSEQPSSAQAADQAEQSVCLHVELDGEPRALADARLLTRILGNLLSNARRHARTIVRLRAASAHGRVEIELADDGTGLATGGASAPELDRLFEPFYRADPARAHGRHVGMGLAIVRKAVEAHGGQVRATLSDLGGLSVSFDLPAAD